jgi:predicted DCC family thiol-disulfide oxidoreductase YuxK
MNRAINATMVFDGDCGFCGRSARFAVDRVKVTCSVFAYQRADLAALGLTAAECAEALRFVAPDGTRFQGAAAVAQALRTAPAPWRALGVAIDAPGVRVVAERVYRFVARHRGTVSGCDTEYSSP